MLVISNSVVSIQWTLTNQGESGNLHIFHTYFHLLYSTEAGDFGCRAWLCRKAGWLGNLFHISFNKKPTHYLELICQYKLYAMSQ